MAGDVPKRIINNLDYTDVWSVEEAAAIVEKTGILEQRFSSMRKPSLQTCAILRQKSF